MRQFLFMYQPSTKVIIKTKYKINKGLFIAVYNCFYLYANVFVVRRTAKFAYVGRMSLWINIFIWLNKITYLSINALKIA